MKLIRLRLPAALLLAIAGSPAVADSPAGAGSQRLAACSRGDLPVCFALLERLRLDPGRRAAIRFHLDELEALLATCAGGDADACDTVERRYPDLPPDVRAAKGASGLKGR